MRPNLEILPKILSASVALCLGIAFPTSAAIAPDATSMGTGTSTASLSFNHTIGGGANRLLVASRPRTDPPVATTSPT